MVRGHSRLERHQAGIAAFVLSHDEAQAPDAQPVPPVPAVDRLRHHIAKEDELIEHHGRRLREAQQRRLSYLDELRKHGGQP